MPRPLLYFVFKSTVLSFSILSYYYNIDIIMSTREGRGGGGGKRGGERGKRRGRGRGEEVIKIDKFTSIMCSIFM